MSLRSCRLQHFFRKVRAHRVLRNHLRRHPQHVRRRAVILRQRHSPLRRVLAGPPTRKAFQENLEAPEGRPAKSVNRLVVVPDHKNVPWLRREQAQQLDLRDVRVLKFIHQDVPEPLPQPLAQFPILPQQLHRLRDQSVQRYRILLPEQVLARSVRPRNLLLPRRLFRALEKRVFIERRSLRLEPCRQPVRVSLVLFARDQLVLTSREKLDEVP